MTQKPFSLCTVLLTGLLVFSLAACDSNTEELSFSTLEIQDLYTLISAEANLSSSQQATFATTLAPHDHADREPGYLWIVADSLRRTLTDEQKEELLNRTPFMERDDVFRGLHGFPGGGAYYGVGGFMGSTRHHGDAPLDEVLNLTDEQQATIQALHEDFRAQIKTLMDARRDGALSDEDFIRQMTDLHEAKRAAMDAVLTSEQKAALETYRAEQEAAFEAFRAEVLAVRDAVLDLTAAESASYDAFLADQLEAREVLHEQFLAGDLTLDALHSEIEALLEAKEAFLLALLDETQYEVVQLHDALTVRMGRRGHRGRFGPGKP